MYLKGISQDFSDCGLHNDKYTKYSHHNVNRAFILTYKRIKIIAYCISQSSILRWLDRIGIVFSLRRE